MISRYQRQVMKDLWSDENKFKSFLAVELAASYAWMKTGLFSEEEFKRLEKASFNIDDIYRIENEVKHDVIAFTRAVSLTLGDEKKWLHYGLTSTDVVDTAQSLILRDVNHILLEDIDAFMKVLHQKALLYKKLPSMGRTHGIHAEITSFGLKYALWYEDFKRLRRLFVHAAEEVSVAKLSGAVGNYSASSPVIQKLTSDYLGLNESNISTQTLQRDRHANYMSVIALIGSELEKIAIEIRHLSRTEVKEVNEYFAATQKGSSAMPHKKNPISSENVTGLSRVLRGYMMTSYENIALWHERDISHSSAERIILSDATTLLDYMLNRYKDTLNLLEVNENQIAYNITLTKGVVYSQKLLSYLIQKGYDRNDAYDLIQKRSLEALSKQIDLLDLLKDDQTILKVISKEELKDIFDSKSYLKYVDDIYDKVFRKDN
ncbi:MAG: adenylosuccinate lyase [Tenericutes bacterium HGW-Tenericutes-2]|jgi:adenylosuccinate lyase|nr:MAG: adenylosuccinate lyase [Tenericutes bacterium HGW-Tenericutes-2]